MGERAHVALREPSCRRHLVAVGKQPPPFARNLSDSNDLREAFTHGDLPLVLRGPRQCTVHDVSDWEEEP